MLKNIKAFFLHMSVKCCTFAPQIKNRTTYAEYEYVYEKK